MQSSSYKLEQSLSLLAPYFSQVATLRENALTISNFLATLIPVDAVTLIGIKDIGYEVESSLLKPDKPIKTCISECLDKDASSLMALIDCNGVAAGDQLDRLLGLDKDIYALCYKIYFDKQLCGFLIVYRSGSRWSEEEQIFMSALRDIMGAAFSIRAAIANESRSSLVFNTMMDSMKISVYITDIETDRILFMNQTMKDEFNISEPYGELCYKTLQKDMQQHCNFCPIDRLLQANGQVPVVQWDEVNNVTGRTYRKYDSLIKWIDGSIVHLQQSIDITDLKNANIDDLTKLLSRRPGTVALQGTMDWASKQDRTLTICFYDINNLKEINEKFGYDQGDQLVAAASLAVGEVLEEGEYSFRLIGDEFVVVFLSSQNNAQLRINAALANLISMNDRYEASFCYGMIEILPNQHFSVEEVLLLADERMYEQKRYFHIARNEKRLTNYITNISPQTFQYDKDHLYDALAKSTDDYPFICNMQTGIFRYSPAMVEEFGLPAEVIDNAAAVWGAMVHDSDKAAFLEANQNIIDGRELSHCVEYRAMNKRGEWVWVRCRGHVQFDQDNNPSIFAGFITNLGKRNQIDNLTGLFNKIEFENDIARRIEELSKKQFGILILGIDDLRHINDLYDRIFGDEVIRITAQRLQTLLPPGASIYRLDGDEFGIIVANADQEDMQKLYKTIKYSFDRQQQYDSKKYYCTLSGGSVIYPYDAKNYLEIMKFAGYCLDYAKRQGKNCCVQYSPGILDYHSRTLEMLEALRDSVENDFRGFSLCFQPLVQASTGKLIGAEVLARWRNDEFGAVSPVEFIPLLEQSGLIIPVGKWVLSSAIAQCSKWLSRLPDFILHVNLSYLQIQNSELVGFVLKTLEEQQFPHSSLVLELTESYFIQEHRHVQAVFEQLRENGIQIAIDDFGTGFSTLSILKDIPVDIVKIDRSFLRNICSSTFDATFIRFVVELCHNVGIDVCLEGVETNDEYGIVSQMNLDIIQGFLFGRPITADEFTAKSFQ